MIGTLHTVVLDCPDPESLAEFSRGILGGRAVPEDDDWIDLVPDLEAAHAPLLALGARFAEAHDGFRVYLDPAGHPFCTVR